MNEIVATRWMGDNAFESKIDEYTIRMDADPEFGGTHYGPRPKPLLLSALAGCTGIDIVSIMRKKQVPFTSFNILVDGEVTDTHPKYYHKIHLVFEVTGPGFEGNEAVMQKVARAVELSRDNYCGVHAMLKHAATITHEIRLING